MQVRCASCRGLHGSTGVQGGAAPRRAWRVPLFCHEAWWGGRTWRTQEGMQEEGHALTLTRAAWLDSART
jgi:hypothetical protein